MNLFKYNIDKIACIVNCSKYIEGNLKNINK